MESRGVLRFARFELDLGAGVLRRDGAEIHVQEKPLRLLEALLARPNQILTRAELQHAPPARYSDRKNATRSDSSCGVSTSPKRVS
jgi:DNA-binding response OmpR family regulator